MSLSFRGNTNSNQVLDYKYTCSPRTFAIALVSDQPELFGITEVVQNTHFVPRVFYLSWVQLMLGCARARKSPKGFLKGSRKT